MKHLQRNLLLFAVILFIATSCKKSVPEQTKYIPKDASFVFDLNWKSLSDKAAKGNINWDSLYHSMSDEGSDSIAKEAKTKIQEFMRSGVDTTQDLFFFVKTGGSAMQGQSVSGAVVGIMKDATAFEAYLKKQPLVGDIQKGSNYSYAKLKDGVFAGWNSDVIIVTGSESGAESTLASLFGMKQEESVSSIPEFQDVVKEKADMIMWTNSSGSLNSIPLLGMTKFADLLKDSYGAGLINFEDGKVTADFKSYSGKDLAAILKKYAGPTANMDMVKQYPYPAEGYAAFSFNPQLIAEIIKYAGMEGTIKQYLDKEGFTMDDILKVFKGDFAVIFSDLKEEDREVSIGDYKYTSKEPTAKLIVNIAIGDKDAYNKIAAKLAEEDESIMKMKDGFYVPAHTGDMAVSMDGKNFILASDSSTLQAYLANKGNAAIPSNVESGSKGKSLAFYVDIAKILDAFTVDSSAKESMIAAKQTFGHAFATSDNYNGSYTGSKMELTTANEKENSLVTLIKFFAAVSKQAVRMENRINSGGMTDMDNMNMDTIPPPPPVDENK